MAFSIYAFLTASLVIASVIDTCSAQEPPKPYIGDTSGCGKYHFPLVNGITDKHTITSSGVSRTYNIHRPDNYDSKKQYGLIVAYHGTSENGIEMELDTKLDLSTPNHIVIYPDGIGANWAGANYSNATPQQDLTFTSDLLADVRKNYCVDSSKVYATGLSNGGGFVGLLACNKEVGGQFAAFAPVAGAFYALSDPGLGGGCTPARDVTPVLEFHGGKDTDVNYNGGPGEGGSLPSIPAWLSWWASRNSCESSATEELFDGKVTRITWTCKGRAGVVQHYLSKNHKHNWPSTIINFSTIASGDTPAEIDASSIIPAFFDKYYRPA